VSSVEAKGGGGIGFRLEAVGKRGDKGGGERKEVQSELEGGRGELNMVSPELPS
jgi:hypothetical protein